ncbi:MAG: LolA family protein [Planctomycetota bacterium]|jgi:outer membrane lipoprotein-sorting protein
MAQNKIGKVLVFVLVTMGCFRAGCVAQTVGPSGPNNVPADAVEKVLSELRQRTEQLESYQARLEYLFVQPEPFDSTRLMKGVMYYKKLGDKSNLRINFQTLKQDDEKTRKHNEQFIFDGVWLTQIDYQLEHVNRYQQAEPNEPVNAFELAKRNFPIVGFTKVEELKKEFEIELVGAQASESGEPIQLHLKVKPNSVYKDNYTAIDVWIDKKSHVPEKIVAVTTEGDMYEIKLLKPRVNKKIDKKVFDFNIPKGFSLDEKPLRETDGGPGPADPAK